MVLIAQHRKHDTGIPLQLCERCARTQAARLGARWPESHEHSATTKQPGHGWATTIRVRPDLDGACDHCVPLELPETSIEDVALGVFEQRARGL